MNNNVYQQFPVPNKDCKALLTLTLSPKLMISPNLEMTIPKVAPSYTFGFKGPEAKTIMNSGRLQESVANQILTGCTSLSAVRFGYWNGWFQTYGLMPDGKIKPFECIEPGVGNKPKWGQVICT
jgi:hypothetical protein